MSLPKSNLYQWAVEQDRLDPLREFRERFCMPQGHTKPLIYFCGNSLGLQPQTSRQVIDSELTKWQNLGVEAWFEGNEPWYNYHQSCQHILANIVEADASEVCPMHQLTVNLHLMLTSFYRPTPQRYKILTVAADFPSDQYALETHIKARGLEPDKVLIEISPRLNEYTIRTEDILEVIKIHGNELALVCMSGLHYYTGQLFDIPTITATAHEVGALAGFDLAHAIGNVPLQLHDWHVDFAVWCSYKYLNSGPGGIGGLFVHQQHHDIVLPRLAGWWGYNSNTRFEMQRGFIPDSGAAGWQISTPNILAIAIHHASLQLFGEAGMTNIYQKSQKLTQFLAQLIEKANRQWGFEKIKIITPAQRGSQLSLLINQEGKAFFDKLTNAGIIGDWRYPNCIRLAPAPLYNTFEEVYAVGKFLLP